MSSARSLIVAAVLAVTVAATGVQAGAQAAPSRVDRRAAEAARLSDGSPQP